jgi:hypothetical protein
VAPPHEPHGRVVSSSERLYRALLAAYPKQFRRAYGREMVQVFRCMCREQVVSGESGGLARLWVRTLLDLLATALAERAKQALGISTLVGSSPTLARWSGLAAGGVLLIASGVLSWVNEALLYGEETAIGGEAQGPQWALGLVYEVGYLLFIGGLAGLFGLLERARRARPSQARAGRSLRLAYCSAVAGLVPMGLAVVATVANVVQLSTVGVVTIGGPGGIPKGSFVDVALDVSYWLKLSGLPLGIVLLGVAVLRWGLLGRWSVLPLAIGLLMKPLLGYFTFYLLALLTGADISDGDIVLNPTPWPDWSGFYMYVVDNAIIGTSWVLLGWVLLSGRGEDPGSGVERASL